MAGRHRAASGRPAWQVTIPAQRGPRPVGIADARDQIEHLVTDESFAEHRHSGRYLAVCGARVLAASLAEPDLGRCQSCVQVVSR